jgi:phosphatidylserine/phosphatidylglycerophosphate/cardiolipin synthase-like enzyme
VNELNRARREILVLAYSFSSKPIAQALIDAKTRGVKVEVVLDKSNEQEQYSDLSFFIEQGLAPLIDSHHAIAHNKVIIIDRRTLVTGSFNFTHQAESDNAENLLVIKGHPELASVYHGYLTERKSTAISTAFRARRRDVSRSPFPVTATGDAKTLTFD